MIERLAAAEFGDGVAPRRDAARYGWQLELEGGGCGDQIARAAFLAAGEPIAAARANAHRGGLFTIQRGGLGIQIIWKTLESGDHYDHIHVGVRQEDALSGEVRSHCRSNCAELSGLRSGARRD